MSRVYSADLGGIAALMADKAGDRLDQFLMFISDHLTNIASEHGVEHDEDPDCRECGAVWPCRTYRSAQTLAIAWLFSEVRGASPHGS